MRGSIKILSIRGINLYMHWTLFLLAGWVAIVNGQLGNDIFQLFWSILFLLAVFACIALHELGHALMARRFGIKAHDIVLLPIGGIASIEKFPDNPRQELLISMAGPLVNIFIAVIIYLILPDGTSLMRSPANFGSSAATTSLADLGTVNIALAVFNLIPAFPMDGGRILRALLGFRLNYIQATTIAANIGKLFAILFIVAGILFINLFLPLIGIFIFLAAGTEEYYLRLKSLAKNVKLSEVVMYEYNGLQAGMLVQEAANILMTNHSKYFLLMEANAPVGVLNRLVIVKAMAEKRYGKTLKELSYEKPEYLNANDAVEDVLEKLARNDERIFPVMDHAHFTGVVSLNHIIEYLLIHKADTQDFERLKSLVTLMH